MAGKAGAYAIQGRFEAIARAGRQLFRGDGPAACHCGLLRQFGLPCMSE